jgi:hypothetical protein
MSSIRNAEKFNGDFIETKNGTIGFFVFQGAFYVFIGKQAYETGPNLKITNERQGKERSLQVLDDGTLIFEHRYKAAKKWDENPFWPEDEEDVDHLLWFANVVTMPERRAVIKQVRKPN